MKTLLALALAVLALAACAPLPTDVRPVAGAPSLGPAGAVPDVLYERPSRPFVEIGVVDAQGVPGMTSAQLLARVREQARQIGADAVIVEDASRRTPPETRYNPATGGFDVTGGQTIPAFKGIAIKYRG